MARISKLTNKSCILRFYAFARLGHYDLRLIIWPNYSLNRNYDIFKTLKFQRQAPLVSGAGLQTDRMNQEIWWGPVLVLCGPSPKQPSLWSETFFFLWSASHSTFTCFLVRMWPEINSPGSDSGILQPAHLCSALQRSTFFPDETHKSNFDPEVSRIPEAFFLFRGKWLWFLWKAGILYSYQASHFKHIRLFEGMKKKMDVMRSAQGLPSHVPLLACPTETTATLIITHSEGKGMSSLFCWPAFSLFRRTKRRNCDKIHDVQGINNDHAGMETTSGTMFGLENEF